MGESTRRLMSNGEQARLHSRSGRARRPYFSGLLAAIGFSLLLHGGGLAAFLAFGGADHEPPSAVMPVEVVAAREPQEKPAPDAGAPATKASRPAEEFPEMPVVSLDRPGMSRDAGGRAQEFPMPRTKPAQPAMPDIASEPRAEADPAVATSRKKAEGVASADTPSEKILPEQSEEVAALASFVETGPAETDLAETGPVETGRADPAASAVSVPRYDVASLRNPPPEYPLSARRLGMEGRTVLRVEVLANGRSGAVILQRSSGHGILDEAALDAVAQWTFLPATEGGVPVPAFVEVPVIFRLE